MSDNYVQFSEALELPTGYDTVKVQKAIAEILVGWNTEEGEDDEIGYTLDVDGLWVHSGAGGDVAKAAELAHCVMSCLDMVGTFVINYCYHCSKLRIGEFGGGVIIVTKDGTKHIDAHALANQVSRLIAEGVDIGNDITITL